MSVSLIRRMKDRPFVLLIAFSISSIGKMVLGGGDRNRNRRRRRRPLTVVTCVLCTSTLGHALPQEKSCFVPTPFPNQVSSPRPLPTHAEFHRQAFRVHATSGAESQDGRQEEPLPPINMEGLSDAQVLLACRSYLSKRKRSNGRQPNGANVPESSQRSTRPANPVRSDSFGRTQKSWSTSRPVPVPVRGGGWHRCQWK